MTECVQRQAVVPLFRLTFVVEPLAPVAANDVTELVAVDRSANTVPVLESVNVNAPPVSPADAVCDIAVPAFDAVNPIAFDPALNASDNAIELPANVRPHTRRATCRRYRSRISYAHRFLTVAAKCV